MCVVSKMYMYLPVPSPSQKTVCDSVVKTGRCVIAHEAPLSGGFAGEYRSVVEGRAFYYCNVCQLSLRNRLI